MGWEPAWAADSAAVTPPASATGATTAPARDQAASKPAPPTNVPDVPRQHTSAQASPAPNLSAVNELLQRQGPIFIENRGQFDPRVKFLVTGNGANLWLTNEGIVFDFQRPSSKQSPDAAEAKPSFLERLSHGREPFDPRLKSDRPPMERLVFKQKLVSANPNPTIEARDPQPGIYNYFTGSDPDKWRTHVLAYKEVVYRDIWKGIDLKLFANGPNLEEEFTVHPGADPSSVQLVYEGIKGLSLADDGSLQVATAFGDMLETSPRIYQEIAGKFVPLSGNFKVGVQNSYTFEVAKHDQQSDLIIDPTVIYSEPRPGKKSGQGNLLYSSFLGGSQGDQGTAIAVDNAGNAYIAGWTHSSDFPTTPGAFQTTAPNGAAFVTKVNALGSAPLVYSTYLGGQNAQGNGIAVDSSGSAYAVGGSAGSGFPTTANAFQSGCGGSAFVTKLTSGGDGLVYSTCLGYYVSLATAVAVDSAGNAYITGFGVDGEYGGSYPTTPNAFQVQTPTINGGAVISVLNPSASGASSLIYSSYLAGTPQDVFYGDRGLGIAVDAYGKAYITGWTTSYDFPVTAGAYMTVYPGQPCCDFCGCAPALGGRLLPSTFVAKFDPLASGAASLIYSTFLGGSLGTVGNGLAVDPLGNTYVNGSTGKAYGYTSGSPVPFPTTPGAFQTVPDGNDAFVTKFNAAGNNLVYSTLLGGGDRQGNGENTGTAIALDASNDAYVTGWTRTSNFPTTPDAFQQYPGGGGGYGANCFVTKFNGAATQLVYSSYLGGGTSDDYADGIAVDAVGDAYMTGWTASIDFPVTSFAFQPAYAGGADAFVTKFPIGDPAGISISAMLPSGGGNAGSVTVEVFGTGFHNGASVALTGACGSAVASPVIVGTGGQLLTATFNLTSNTPGVCDVTVVNVDGSRSTLSNAFTVVQGGGADVRLSVIATGVEPGFDTTYTISASNVGSIDSPEFMVGQYVEPWHSYQIASPSPSETLTGPVGWPLSIVGSGQTYDNFLNWEVPALGSHSSLPFSSLLLLNGSFPRGLNVTSQSCRTRSSSLRNCEDTQNACVAFAIADCFRLSHGDQNRYAVCLQNELAACLAGYVACVNGAGPWGLGLVAFCGRSIMPAGYSGDPNYIVGPTGVGTQMWVAGIVPLTYTVQFENEPGATYPAQQVITTDVLNPALMTPSSLQLATMIVTGHQVPIPSNFVPQAGLDEFFTNLDLRPAQNLFVKIHVQLNPSTGLVTWTFTSIDPATGLPPTDPSVGFLAPGASVSLFFTVNPKPALPTGTQITDQATVIFDLNPPVNTNTWVNTLDNTPPTSQVTALPGTELCTNFNVQWSGTDIGSGIANYTIYVSDNGGAFTAWQTNTTATSAVYNGQVGHSYGFYSIAQDLVGNIEPGKSAAEATTQVKKGTICGPIGPPTPL
jgi:hypothetical protein